MGKPKAPRAPDPVATAGAQTASNVSTAIAQQQLNTIGQTGPQGSISYDQTGTYQFKDPSTGETYTLPKLTQTTTLSPEQQKLYDSGIRTQGTMSGIAERQAKSVGDLLSNRLSLDGLPEMRTSIAGADDYSKDRQRVEDALMARMNPQIEQDRERMETALINKGIRVGSDAYGATQSDFGRNVNDARLGAILSAGQEQSRLQGMDLNAANFANQARSQALNERLTERNQGLNENIALATGSQVSMPQFGATPQTGMAGTDIAGINQGAYNGQLSAYNTNMNQWNSTMGGLFGLGANALLAFSDKRLKEDITPTNDNIGGIPVKEWTWKGTGVRDRGVIAQDVEKKRPEMVDNTHPSGFKRVNYGGLMQLGRSAKGRAA